MKVHREQFLAAAMMLSAAAPLGGCQAQSDQTSPESINAEGAQALGTSAVNAPSGAPALNGAAPNRAIQAQNSPLGLKGVGITPATPGHVVASPTVEGGLVAPTKETVVIAPTREVVGVVAPTREIVVAPRPTVTTPSKVPPPPIGRPQVTK